MFVLHKVCSFFVDLSFLCFINLFLCYLLDYLLFIIYAILYSSSFASSRSEAKYLHYLGLPFIKS